MTIHIRSARFVGSAASSQQFPSDNLPAIAFSGRSNSGKSTLINAILGRKNLAKSSSIPGKTRLINFFEVNYHLGDVIGLLYFVDLPGYGYAARSKSERNSWKVLVQEYLFSSLPDSLIVLQDARRKVEEEEAMLLSQSETFSLIYVATKWDKLSQKEKSKSTREFKGCNLLANIPVYFTSGVTTCPEIVRLKEEIFQGFL